MPKYCVQGERIPFYVLWKEPKNVRISLTLPAGLILKEVYNIDSSNVSRKDDTYTTQNFEIDGYFGGVIQSQLYEEAFSVKTVKFSIITNSDSTQNFDKNIDMFRPDIKISNDATEITISNSNGKQTSDRQIPLYNHGKGTGIIKIDILDDSEIKEGTPEGFEKFKIAFLEDIKQSFDDLASKFPQYKDTLDEFFEFADDPLPSKSEKLDELRNIIDELEKIFDNDEEFYEDFIQSVATSYLKNVSVLTDVITFLAFMKSVGRNRIIFVDAMKVLKISTTPKKLHANLIVTDLVRNKYSPIELPNITLASDVESTIPVYQIFNTLETNC